MYSNKSLSEAIRERLFSVEGKNEETLKYPATETAQLTAAAKRYQPQDRNPYSPTDTHPHNSSRRTSTQPKILLGSSHGSFMLPGGGATTNLGASVVNLANTTSSQNTRIIKIKRKVAIAQAKVSPIKTHMRNSMSRLAGNEHIGALNQGPIPQITVASEPDELNGLKTPSGANIFANFAVPKILSRSNVGQNRHFKT